MIRKIRKSLMLKWMIFSILLATIPLIIASFSIIQIYQENLKKSVIIIEKEKADIVVERTRSFFEKISSNLCSLSSDEYFKKRGSSGHIKNLMEEFLYRNDYLSELTFLNEKGKEMVKVSKYKVFKPSDLKDQSKTGRFQIASKGHISYGDFQLTEDIVPTMMIAVPIEEYRGRPTGVLSAEFHLRYLWNLIPQIQVGEKGTTYVVDSGGNLIAHPDTRRVLSKTNLRHLSMVNLALDGKEGDLEFEPSEGGKYLVVYKPVKDLRWGVIVQVPIEEAYKPVGQVTHTVLGWILMVLCVAILFSLLLTRTLTNPIKRLSNQMAKVSKGDLDVHIVPTTRDELGLLTESFNQMIGDLKRSQETLKETEEKYRRIFENSKDMVYISSVDGKFIDVNQAGLEMLGYSSIEELRQVDSGEIYLNTEDRKKFFTEIDLKGFVKDLEAKLRKKDGTEIDCLITSTVQRANDGSTLAFQGIIRDITSRKRAEEALKAMSLRDDLTGLYNRRGFLTLAGQELKIANRMKRRIFLLFTDLDDLKVINDTFGHLQGDQALIDTARIMKETFRDPDILARIGGDEFVILGIAAASETGPELLMKRLQKNLDLFNEKTDHPYQLSLSMGVVGYDPEHPVSIDNLLIQADNSMYEEKQRKKKFKSM